MPSENPAAPPHETVCARLKEARWWLKTHAPWNSAHDCGGGQCNLCQRIAELEALAAAAPGETVGTPTIPIAILREHRMIATGSYPEQICSCGYRDSVNRDRDLWQYWILHLESLAAAATAPPKGEEMGGMIRSLSEVVESTKKLQCPICGWPLEDSIEKGCIPGNCSYRPAEGSDEYRRIEKRKEDIQVDAPASPPANEKPPYAVYMFGNVKGPDGVVVYTRGQSVSAHEICEALNAAFAQGRHSGLQKAIEITESCTVDEKHRDEKFRIAMTLRTIASEEQK